MEQRQYMRVLDVGGDLDLLEKPLRTDDRRQLWMQNLDGNLTVVFEVLRGIDGGHATHAKLTLEGVSVGKGGCETVE